MNDYSKYLVSERDMQLSKETRLKLKKKILKEKKKKYKNYLANQRVRRDCKSDGKIQIKFKDGKIVKKDLTWGRG